MKNGLPPTCRTQGKLEGQAARVERQAAGAEAEPEAAGPNLRRAFEPAVLEHGAAPQAHIVIRQQRIEHERLTRRAAFLQQLPGGAEVLEAAAFRREDREAEASEG